MNKVFQHPQVTEEYIPNYVSTGRIYLWERRKKKGLPHTSPARSAPAQRVLILAEKLRQVCNKRNAVIWRAEIALIQNGTFLCFKTLSQLLMPYEQDSSVCRRWPADSTGFCCLAREKQLAEAAILASETPSELSSASEHKTPNS